MDNHIRDKITLRHMRGWVFLIDRNHKKNILLTVNLTHDHIKSVSDHGQSVRVKLAIPIVKHHLVMVLSMLSKLHKIFFHFVTWETKRINWSGAYQKQLLPQSLRCKPPLLFSYFLTKVISVINVLILPNCHLFVCVLNLTIYISRKVSSIN